MSVIKGGVVLSGLLLAVGLMLHAAGSAPLASQLLAAGLLLLMAIPAARIFITIAEWMRQKEWPFVAVALVVVVELAIALILAMRRV